MYRESICCGHDDCFDGCVCDDATCSICEKEHDCICDALTDAFMEADLV